MIVEEKKLLLTIGCCKDTLRKHLNRMDFSHIKPVVMCGKPKTLIYKDINDSDIEKIKGLIQWKTKTQKN